MLVLYHAAVVSCPDPPSGGCGEREKEGLGNNPGWKCPGGMLCLRNNSMTKCLVQSRVNRNVHLLRNQSV